MKSAFPNKIFIIGFNKTGTKTLHSFFKANKIKSIHWHGGKIARRMVDNAMAGKRLLRGYDRKYRVFSDMIWLTQRVCVEGNAFFRIMDRDYPGSAFIYNTRDEDAWLKSRQQHARGTFLADFMKSMNTESEEEAIAAWRETRRRFEAHMFAYFKGRNDLLVYDITKNGPQDIIEFLGLPLDPAKYSWVNKTGANRDTD
jgi:hypothetical protein